jgi:rod shape-determining protein MreD
MLLAAQGITVLVRLAAGDDFPGWPVFVGPLAGALLWPPANWLLLLPQRRPAKEQTI